uniref:Uncharacterized protein n=1 Tax=Rhizophora mucronata TaxID=61149 RepID=A0A2P2PED7_RHIMU
MRSKSHLRLSILSHLTT